MAIGVVTEYLFQLIAKQVEDRGLVVWYDSELAKLKPRVPNSDTTMSTRYTRQMAPVAATSPILNFCVARMRPVPYTNSMIARTPILKPLDDDARILGPCDHGYLSRAICRLDESSRIQRGHHVSSA